MKSLLDKVRTIEQEATELIEEEKKRGNRAVQDILSREDKVIENIKASAEQKAEAIVNEKIHAVGDVINKLKQESKQSVEIVHEVANTNRSRALARARTLFEEYILNS